MKKYNRVMLGKGGALADECVSGGYIGVNFLPEQDLSMDLPETCREFNKKYVPVWLAENPGKSKVAAGLSCGYLWTVCKGLSAGDIVLAPNGKGEYYVGEIVGGYYYSHGETLPQRRKVKWLERRIRRDEMSDQMKHSTCSLGTCCDLTSQADEIEKLINVVSPVKIVATDEQVEDPSAFALEKHLEEFLVRNWKQTELGKNYDIFEEDGEPMGQQYDTEVGPIDILAVSKDKKQLLVIELKRGRASDVVLGQIQRYMGYVQEEICEPYQTVRGLIIGLESDEKLTYALKVCTGIEFYRYQIDFKLIKG